jgi:succinoglycan biosynthesis transport protein ExoP
MEEQTKELKDYLDAFRRRRTLILSVAAVIFVVSVLAALFWPPTYRSTATILIEEQEVPQDLVRSTITSFATERIQTISQTVMTRANLMQIVEKYDLYHRKRQYNTTEDILDQMRKDISVNMINADVIDPRSGQPRPATIAFTLSYDGDGAAVTQKVASELTSLFLSENLKTRTEKATETYSFLSDEANKLKEHIADLETQLAAFKEKNAGRLPELTSLNMQLRERTDGELRDVENQLRSLDDRKFYLEGQLAQINPLTPTIGAEGQQILDPVTQLKTLRSQYISASAKYAPDHPDVVRLRREIEGLEKQTGSVDSSTEQAKTLAALRTELAAAREKYSPDHPDVIRLTKAVAAQEEALKQKTTPETVVAKEKPDNPAYLTLQAQLEGVKSEMQTYTAQREQLKAKLGEYEKRLQQTPEVERNYLVLTRDYDNSVKRYQELKAKQNEAQVGQELEKERKGERFSLIDPPELPEKPVKPNRPAIIILGFLLSLASGVGFTSVAESMDSSVRGVRGVIATLESPPLSIIPYLQNSEDLARAEKTKRIVITVFASSFVLILLLIHFFWTPLDVLWFRGLRKADTVIGG